MGEMIRCRVISPISERVEFAWDDVPYDLSHEQVWALLQLRHQRPVRRFDPTLSVQTSPPASDEPDGATLAYVPNWSEAAEATLRELVTGGQVLAFSGAPGALREALNLPNLSIEPTPGHLLDEFPQVIAGL